MGFFSTPKLSLLCTIFLLQFLTSSAAFKCTAATATATCNSLIDYIPQNATTLDSIKTLFNVTHLRYLLGANNLPLSTDPTRSVPSGQKILVPFTCLCSNGTGLSNRKPQYVVKPGDNLDGIAIGVFLRLVTHQDIAAANKILDPSVIVVGQRLWIPLPCSCDDVDSQRVVHYGHVVEMGSSVEEIATEYGTTQETLLRVNGISDPKTLQANQVLDVPLKACSSSVSNASSDAPLLVSNNTYIFTASNCVKCLCSSANNWTLQCDPSNLSSKTCPVVQCEASNLVLGNTTTSGCNQTTCAYAGYSNKTVRATLVTQSTCAAPDGKNNASKIGFQGSSWNFIFVAVHMILLSSTCSMRFR